MPYSPLGHGLLTGQIRTIDDFADDDWRKSNPRFIGENFACNLAIVDEVTRIGAEIGATPAQTTLAWLLTQLELTLGQLERLDALTPASGARHNEANMASIDR